MKARRHYLGTGVQWYGGKVAYTSVKPYFKRFTGTVLSIKALWLLWPLTKRGVK